MSLWNAQSVNPDTITPADIAEVAAQLSIDITKPVPADFAKPGETYLVRGDRFRCAAVGYAANGRPEAIGYLPVNLGGRATWEFAVAGGYDWTKVGA